MKKKILFFIKTPPPVNGATIMNSLVNESQLLRKRFHITSIEIHYVKAVNQLGKLSLFKLFIILKSILRLTEHLVFQRPHLVYFQISPLGLAFLRDSVFVFLIKLFRVRIIYHLHGKGINKAVSNNKILRFYYRMVFHNTAVICLSPSLVHDIAGIYSGTPFIVPNALRVADISKNTSVVNKPVKILFLSNLFKSKGIIDFVEALAILDEEKCEFEAQIVGDSGDLDKQSINSLLNSKKLSQRISYLGPKYGEEKYKILERCDLFVFPTREDVWGLVLLEAMQASKPVVASREGAIPEIVDDGVTGFLVEKGNPRQIAEKIKLLIESESLRTRMGEEGRKKFLRKYTYDVFEENLTKTFNKVLQN